MLASCCPFGCGTAPRYCGSGFSLDADPDPPFYFDADWFRLFYLIPNQSEANLVH
jgi:hypothetical protein